MFLGNREGVFEEVEYLTGDIGGCNRLRLVFQKHIFITIVTFVKNLSSDRMFV